MYKCMCECVCVFERYDHMYACVLKCAGAHACVELAGLHDDGVGICDA